MPDEPSLLHRHYGVTVTNTLVVTVAPSKSVAVTMAAVRVEISTFLTTSSVTWVTKRFW